MKRLSVCEREDNAKRDDDSKHVYHLRDNRTPWVTLCGRDVANGTQIRVDDFGTLVFDVVWCSRCRERQRHAAGHSHKGHKLT